MPESLVQFAMIRIHLTGLWILLFCVPSHALKMMVSPSGGTASINERINALSAGDTMVFQPGVYNGPFTLNGVNGRPNLPIVISGMRGGPEIAVIDGKSKAGMDLKNNAFQLRDCSWIVIEGFRILHCWTDIITAVDVSYLSVDKLDVHGGKRLLYAMGLRSHHFLVENCRWEQDIRVWTHDEGYTWEDLHHGKYRHYNGSIFQGDRISGVFVLRNNEIRNTFNAFRLSPVNEGEVDLLSCSNGEIYNNLIINTSDNVFEPEVYCHNLYFHHNRLINGHAFISVTEVGGGPIYLYGNTGLSEPDCDDGWAIYKISNNQRTLSAPFYIFNNSWYVDYNITGRRMGWWNDHLVHFNNAYFLMGIDTFGILTSGEDSYFNHDCSSAGFPDFFDGKGFESDGVEGDPLFTDPLGNDFRLQDGSPCFDAGQSYADMVFDYEGKAPDIGAYEGNRPVMGPAFKFSKPPADIPFTEHPRITRFKVADNKLSLWFSVPMDNKQMISCKPVLKTENISIRAELESVEDNGYCFRFLLEKKIDPVSDPELILSAWPESLGGVMMTSWASAMKVAISK